MGNLLHHQLLEPHPGAGGLLNPFSLEPFACSIFIAARGKEIAGMRGALHAVSRDYISSHSESLRMRLFIQ